MHLGGMEEGKVHLCIEYMTPRYEMRKVLIMHRGVCVTHVKMVREKKKGEKHVYFKSASALGRLILYRLGYKIHEARISPPL
jgi:hypothetical protein